MRDMITVSPHELSALVTIEHATVLRSILHITQRPLFLCMNSASGIIFVKVVSIVCLFHDASDFLQQQRLSLNASV